MKTFHCNHCGNQVFFENVHCEQCHSMLGYQPELRSISSFARDESGLWRSLHPHSTQLLYKQCVNYSQTDVCNWMLPADSPKRLCTSCELTRTIPNLGSEQNRLYWKRLETAKRRLLYSLSDLHLQPAPKTCDSDDSGLAFDFLEDLPDQKVMTGHDNGLITINIAEADPASREKMRERMHEPYRTLLGHFRHESGHYYFDRLIVDTTWQAPFRTLFGDERVDYKASLEHYYRNGQPPDWEQRYVTSYASAHPWEDWAETWAHYLHMIDTLDTAYACGLTLEPRKPDEPTLNMEQRPLRIDSFHDMSARWFALTYVLNSLNRSVGMPDPYPFALSVPVLEKLSFIHDVVLANKNRQTSEPI